MASAGQIKKIHALRDDLRLDDGTYRALLATYHRFDAATAESSTALSLQEASYIIKAMERSIDATPEVRSRVYASDRQLKMMFALWHTITGSKDAAGTRKTLLTFLEHHFHIRDINHIPKRKMPKIIYPLSIMARQKAAARSRSTTAATRV